MKRQQVLNLNCNTLYCKTARSVAKFFIGGWGLMNYSSCNLLYSGIPLHCGSTEASLFVFKN